MEVTHNFVEHHVCRLCGSADLQEIFTLGDQFINDFVTEDRVGSGNIAPLELVRCEL